MTLFHWPCAIVMFIALSSLVEHIACDFFACNYSKLKSGLRGKGKRVVKAKCLQINKEVVHFNSFIWPLMEDFRLKKTTLAVFVSAIFLHT